jgi:hypothetical protein
LLLLLAHCIVGNSLRVDKPISAVIVGGQEDPLVDSSATSATLALFDVDTNRWMDDIDIDGSLPRRIGHSSVTIDQRAYVFGGECLDAVHCPFTDDDDGKPAASMLVAFNDVHRLSLSKRVLLCERVAEPISDNHTGDADGAVGSAADFIKPTPRAWHASAAVKLPAASETPENPTFSHKMLVLGGKDATGTLLADVWTLSVDRDAPIYWAALSVSADG